jgi:hypothetical protein
MSELFSLKSSHSAVAPVVLSVVSTPAWTSLAFVMPGELAYVTTGEVVALAFQLKSWSEGQVSVPIVRLSLAGKVLVDASR